MIKYKNRSINTAKAVKDDEFYTQISDIKREVNNFKKYLKGKIIYCNCDDPSFSNFYKFLKDNIKELGIKKLLFNFYNKETGEGDFRSIQAIEKLRESDIVISNPPFTLFREYLNQLIVYKKKFLIVGPTNSIICKEIAPLMINNKIRFGYNFGLEFTRPGKDNMKLGTTGWYTNLPVNKQYKEIELTKTYSNEEYPKYDNADAIHCKRVSDIPLNYTGIIGVPISYMYKNPNQFEALSILVGDDGKQLRVNGKRPFSRMLIRKK